MKIHLGIFLIQIILDLVYSNEIIGNQELDKFLIYYDHQSSEAQSGALVNLEDSPKKGEAIKPIRCFWLETDTMNVFDLKELKRPFNQKYISENEEIVYNFCENTINQCNNQLSQSSYFNKDGNCTKLAGDIKYANKWSLLNATDPKEGIKIQLNSGGPCPVGDNTTYLTTFILKCNPDMKSGKFELVKSDFVRDRCENSFEFKSKEACPKVNFYVIWNFLKQFSIIFGAVLILIGIFETFYGSKVMIVTIFLVTCLSTITLVFILLFQFVIPSGGNPSIVWVVLGISSVVGIFLGYLVSKYNKQVIGLILGGYMGYIAGMILYDSIFVHIQASPKVVYWSTIIISIIICIIAAYYLVDQVIIVSTSLIGSYAIIRGISLYAGGFPDESYVIDLIKNNELDQLAEVLKPVVYAYLVGWLILFIVGLYVQNKLNQEKKEKEEFNENARYYYIKK